MCSYATLPVPIHTIPGVPKKRNGGFSVSCELNVWYIFYKRLPQNRMIPISLICWSNFDSMPISWNTVIFNFRLIFATDERRILLWREEPSIRCFVEAHWSVFLLLPRINGLPQNTFMEALSRHNSSLIGRKNPAKFQNDCISRSGYRFKITQPNLMILVSFSSAEDAVSIMMSKIWHF